MLTSARLHITIPKSLVINMDVIFPNERGTMSGYCLNNPCTYLEFFHPQITSMANQVGLFKMP